MGMFKTKLEVEQVEDSGEQGRGTWRLLAPLVYESDVAATTIEVPAGFITDFASVPRVPLVFDWLGDRGNLAATVHDFLYTAPHPFTRAIADAVLREALIAQGVAHEEAEAIYLGVHEFGGLYWD